jgi:long-chain acyl-CoA synthetase
MQVLQRETKERVMATETRDVLAERAEIDAEVEGKVLGDILLRNSTQYGDRPVLVSNEDGEWRQQTWSEYRDQVAEAAMGLAGLGVKHGDFVAIMSRNRPEHMVADFGAVHAGATGVSIYNSLAPEQIGYIAGHCEAKVAIVEDREFMERWEKIKPDLPALEHVVLMENAEDFADYDWVLSWDELMRRGAEALAKDRDAFERMWREVKPEDPATLVYTSGTTGPPKAVMITHYNILWTAASVGRAWKLPVGMRGVSYLPLAHIAERMISHYLGLWFVGFGATSPEITQVTEAVKQIHPDVFLGVPRVWEKVQAGVMAKLAEEPDQRKRKIAERAIQVGKETVRLQNKSSLSLAERGRLLVLQAQHALFDRLVYSKIRHGAGFDRLKYAVTAAAPISMDTMEFFHGIGIKLLEVYGMTEDSGPATTNLPNQYRLGTVGKALPGVEVKVAEDGEVLVRGGNVVPGYYKDPEKTAETFDAEGWLHTGDIGVFDDEGWLKIVDRKKELIITAGGKNISPANIEALLKEHPLVGQACAIGDMKPYISALIVLDGEVAPGWAQKNGLAFTDLGSFAQEPRVQEEIARAVEDANQKVSQVEGVKRWTILPTEWTAESDELTPTLKLKRRVIHQKYEEEIDGLYAR